MLGAVGVATDDDIDGPRKDTTKGVIVNGECVGILGSDGALGVTAKRACETAGKRVGKREEEETEGFEGEDATKEEVTAVTEAEEVAVGDEEALSVEFEEAKVGIGA